MALKTTNIRFTGGCLFCDGDPAEVGDKVKMTLDPEKYPSFIGQDIIGVIKAISTQGGDKIYTVEYESDDLPDGIEELDDCDLARPDGFQCFPCCEEIRREIEPRFTKIEDCVFDQYLTITDPGNSTGLIVKDDPTIPTFVEPIVYEPDQTFPLVVNLTQIYEQNGVTLTEENLFYDFTYPALDPVIDATSTVGYGCKEESPHFGITDNGDGTATTSNGICLKTCSASDASLSHIELFNDFDLINPDATAPTDADIPNAIDKEVGDRVTVRHQPKGHVVIYERQPDGTWEIHGVIYDPDSQSSQLTVVSNPDGSQTVTHTGGVGSGLPTVFNIPATGSGSASIFGLVNNPDGSVTITHDPGDGSGPTTHIIPAPATGAVSVITSTTNPDGSITYIHNDGDLGGLTNTWTIPPPDMGNLQKLVDPAEPCSLRIEGTDSSGDVRNLDGFGQTNTYSEQSAPSNTTGAYVSHEIRGENDGVELDTQAVRVIPTDVNQKVIITETKSACERKSTINVEGYTGNTLHVDGVFGNDTTAIPYRSDAPYKTALAAETDRLAEESLIFEPNVYGVNTVSVTNGGGWGFNGRSRINAGNNGQLSFVLNSAGNGEDFHLTGKPDFSGGRFSANVNDNKSASFEMGGLKGRGWVQLQAVDTGTINFTFDEIENTTLGGADSIGLDLFSSGRMTVRGGDITTTSSETNRAALSILASPATENVMNLYLGNIHNKGLNAPAILGTNTNDVRKFNLYCGDIRSDGYRAIWLVNAVHSFTINCGEIVGASKGVDVRGLSTDFGRNKIRARVIDSQGDSNVPGDPESSYALHADKREQIYVEADYIVQSNVSGSATIYLNNQGYVTAKSAIIESMNPTRGIIDTDSSGNQLTLIGCSVRTQFATFDSVTTGGFSLHTRDSYYAAPPSASVTVLSGTVNVVPLANLPTYT